MDLLFYFNAHDIVAGLRQQFETIIGEQIERSPVVARTAAEVRAQLEQLYEHHCRHVEATFYNELRLVSEELPLRLKLLATALNAHYEQLPAGDKAEVLGDMTAILFPEIPTRFYQCAFKYAGTALNRLFRGTPARVLQEAREIPNPRVVLETEFVDGEWHIIKPKDLLHEPKLPVKYEPKLPMVVEEPICLQALPVNEPLPAPVLRLGGATTEVRVGEVPVRMQPACPGGEPVQQIPKFTHFAEGKLQKHFDRHVIKMAEWGYLVDAFRNGKIEFSFRLGHIQTVYESFGIELEI